MAKKLPTTALMINVISLERQTRATPDTCILVLGTQGEIGLIQRVFLRERVNTFVNSIISMARSLSFPQCDKAVKCE